MSETKQRRFRWKRLLIAGVLLLLLVLGIYPLWLPWIAVPVAHAFDTDIGTYVRRGYSEFQLRDVQWTGNGTTVTAEVITLPMPHRLLLEKGSRHAQPQVKIQNWSVNVGEATEEKPAREPGELQSSADVLNFLEANLPKWTEWLDHATASGGEVTVNNYRIGVPQLVWVDSQLQVSVQEEQTGLTELTAVLSQTPFLLVNVTNPLLHTSLQLRQQTNVWTAEGAVHWKSNTFEWAASFDQTNWTPATAHFTGTNLFVRPADYGVSELNSARGWMRVVWTNGYYGFNAHSSLRPAFRSGIAPTNIVVNLSGQGTLQALALEQLTIEAPNLQASLSDPLALSFEGEMLVPRTRFQIWADLQQLPALEMDGRLFGHLDIRPNQTNLVQADFQLGGAGIEGYGVTASTLDLEGQLEWPRLSVTNLTVRMENDAQLRSSGEFNLARLEAQSLELRYEGEIPKRLLGDTMSLGSVALKASASGTWPDLNHQGHFESGAFSNATVRLDSAELDWSGIGIQSNALSATLRSLDSALDLNGAMVLTTTNGLRGLLDIDRFQFTSPGGELKLSDAVRIQAAQTSGSNLFEVTTTPFILNGGESSVQLEGAVRWPETGTGRVNLQQINAADFSDFIVPAYPGIQLRELDTSFGWTNGPMQLSLSLSAEMNVLKDANFAVDLTMQTSPDGIEFEEFLILQNSVSVFELTGSIPATITPSNTNAILRLASSDKVRIDLKSVHSEPLWRWVESATGIQAVSPAIDLKAEGTVEDLNALLSFKADSLTVVHTNLPPSLPPLENISIQASADRQTIRLDRGSFELLGHPARFSAAYPVHAANWAEWFQQLQTPDPKQATGRFALTNMELASLERFATGILAPSGRLNFNVSLQTNLQINGGLTVTNASTRPIDPVGTLRDIQAALTFTGSQAEVRGFRATLGGRPVTAAGLVEWKPDGSLKMDAQVTGTNLSLVRKPGIFVRGDVDLQMTGDYEETPTLSGVVILHDGLLFQDFRSLVNINLNQPAQRPPFFSVDSPVVGDWKFDIDVQGDRFLRVMSPAFKGTISTDLQLTGTFREPQAIGDINIDEGNVIFPFGILEMERGRVTLSRESPYRPQVDVQARGLNFGYQVSIIVTGPAESPNISFQSVPPLSSKEILLMLTAGNIPRKDFQFSNTDKASRLGMYLGKSVLSQLFSNDDSEERLHVRTGEYVTEDGRLTYTVEYDLADRWSAFGEYNRFRDFNLGLKFKVLSK